MIVLSVKYVYIHNIRFKTFNAQNNLDYFISLILQMVYDIGPKEYLMKHRISEDWDVWAYKMKAAMDYKIM